MAAQREVSKSDLSEPVATPEFSNLKGSDVAAAAKPVSLTPYTMRGSNVAAATKPDSLTRYKLRGSNVAVTTKQNSLTTSHVYGSDVDAPTKPVTLTTCRATVGRSRLTPATKPISVIMPKQRGSGVAAAAKSDSRTSSKLDGSGAAAAAKRNSLNTSKVDGGVVAPAKPDYVTRSKLGGSGMAAATKPTSLTTCRSKVDGSGVEAPTKPTSLTTCRSKVDGSGVTAAAKPGPGSQLCGSSVTAETKPELLRWPQVSEVGDKVKDKCEPCMSEGKHTQAEIYCRDCRLALCGTCLEQHGNFPSFKNHMLTQLLAERRCMLCIAEGKTIKAETICRDCAHALCGTCLKQHGNCTAFKNHVIRQLSDASCDNKYTAKTSDDNRTCWISGICRLADGRTVVTDWGNDAVKLLNLSYAVVYRLQLSSVPADVCVTGQAEVAVSLMKRQAVAFLSVGETLTITRKFDVGQCCRGLVFHDGLLYVACWDLVKPGTGRVLVYSTGGEMQREIGGPETGVPSMFSRPQYITAEGGRIYVSDSHKGVIVMDVMGRVLSVISELATQTERGVCRRAASHVLVCSVKTESVVRIGPGLQDVSTVLQKSDGLCQPWCLCYDASRRQLFVSMYKSDLLHVFDVSL